MVLGFRVPLCCWKKVKMPKHSTLFARSFWVLELGLRDSGLGCEERLKSLGFTTGVGDVQPQASLLFPHLNHMTAFLHRHSGPLHKRAHLQMVVTLVGGGARKWM